VEEIPPKDAEPSTRAVNAAVRAALPFEDRRDFTDARRGLIATLPEGIARAASGQIIWRLSDYDFLDAEEAPATVNPSLWRMARLNREAGLFHVTDRVYQLRSIDIANMTIVETDNGIVIIDADDLRNRPGRSRALLRAPAAPADRRDHLYPQPRRSFRRHQRHSLG
jgi:alkyl sulfatase BDS1-like metallo-beta-lactamase superfamily hydrolase